MALLSHSGLWTWYFLMGLSSTSRIVSLSAEGTMSPYIFEVRSYLIQSVLHSSVNIRPFWFFEYVLRCVSKATAHSLHLYHNCIMSKSYCCRSSAVTIRVFLDRSLLMFTSSEKNEQGAERCFVCFLYSLIKSACVRKLGRGI